MAEGTTRRVDDGSPVAWNDAVTAWAAAGRPALEKVARIYGAYLTYEQLSEAVQEDTGIRTGVPFRHWIGKVLGEIAAQPRIDPAEPFLTALVVRADGTIGDGYAGPLRDRDGVVPGDLDAQAAEERLRCYRFFGAELPADGGRPQLTREVAARRRNRMPQSAVVRKVCPTCHLQLPASGRCDGCSPE